MGIWERGFLCLLGLILLGLSLNDLRSRSRVKLSVQGNEWAASHLAYVEATLTSVFDRHRAYQRRSRAAIAAALGFILTGTAWMHLSQAETVFLLGWTVVITFGVATTTASVYATAFMTEEFVGGSAAHSRAVTVGDYVPMHTRAIAGFSGACAAIAMLILMTVALRTGITWSFCVSIVLSSLVAVAAVVAEWAANTIAGTPQPAKDAAHLYWQDALRSDAIGEAYLGIPLWAGQVALYSSIWLDVEIFDWFAPAGFALLALSVLAAWGAQSLRFRRTLWPTLLPGQVLMPGELPPPRTSVGAHK